MKPMNIINSLNEESNLEKALNLKTSKGGRHGRIAGAVSKVKSNVYDIIRFVEQFGGVKLTFDEAIEFVKKYDSEDNGVQTSWADRINNTPSSYREGIAKDMFASNMSIFKKVFNDFPSTFANEKEFKSAIDKANEELASNGLPMCLTSFRRWSGNFWGVNLRKVIQTEYNELTAPDKSLGVIAEIHTFSYHSTLGPTLWLSPETDKD